jgi:hypothetical protein
MRVWASHGDLGVGVYSGGIGFGVAKHSLKTTLELQGPDTSIWFPSVGVTHYHIIGSSAFTGFIPLWCLFSLAVIPTVILWRHNRVFPPNLCQVCGYNLTGNESGVCPECGTEIAPP